MKTQSCPLEQAAQDLKKGNYSSNDYLSKRYDRINKAETDVHAWVDGAKPQDQAEAEASALHKRYPEPDNRPPLFGIPIGVKDIIHVNGLPTYAGSSLPPGELVDKQAPVITSLQQAGAIVLGKTVTTEFAYFEPGPTRNPHDLAHTPGGSSSGSAAAVTAGMCPLALGTQTVGSVIRPATFCGIIGFKPTFDCIPTDGVIPLSTSVDHVGLFTQDIPGMRRAASVCIENWTETSESKRPTLGVPDGEYLDQASADGQDHFNSSLSSLRDAGYDIRRIDLFPNIEEINYRHNRLVAADAAITHDEWHRKFESHYANETTKLITEGQEVSAKEISTGRQSQLEVRNHIEDMMSEHSIDIWISPGSPGTAPEGIDSTGDPVMNLPWTHAGLPTVAIPTGKIGNLPIGIQCTAGFNYDEELLMWSEDIASVF